MSNDAFEMHNDVVQSQSITVCSLADTLWELNFPLLYFPARSDRLLRL